VAGEFILLISEEAALKSQLLQHLPALLQTLAAQLCNPGASAAAATAAAVLCRLTISSYAQGNKATGDAIYAGSAGQAALAACDLAPLLQGMLSNSCQLSSDCRVALHNVSLTAAGKEAVCQCALKHTAAWVQALQPVHACNIAQLALDTLRSLCESSHTGRAAVLQHVTAIAHAVHQRLAENCKDGQTGMRQPYIRLVQQLMKAADGIAAFSQPKVLDQVLIHLQAQLTTGASSADKEAAASCIEALAAAVLEGLRQAHQWELYGKLKGAAAAVAAAAKAAREAAEKRAAEAAWQAELQDAAAVFPAADALAALPAAELKKRLRDEVSAEADISTLLCCMALQSVCSLGAAHASRLRPSTALCNLQHSELCFSNLQ
jgi:hypothetical protein